MIEQKRNTEYFAMRIIYKNIGKYKQKIKNNNYYHFAIDKEKLI